MKKLLTFAVLAVCLVAGTTAHASSVTNFYQGFETDTSGWSDGGVYGNITRVASGTDGITSASGNYHAVVTGVSAGPFTAFGGYADTFPDGGYITSLDIYLATDWAAGSGFDYSVASSGSDGGHQRDFIFHVTQDISTGDLLVGASNNAGAGPRQDLETLANHFVVSSAGWYTFQHVFRDNGGVLAVDLNLLDSNGTLLWSHTLQNASDTIPAEVGGNRYGWFPNLAVEGGLAIDNTQLVVVPEPATMSLLGLSILGLGVRHMRRRAARS